MDGREIREGRSDAIGREGWRLNNPATQARPQKRQCLLRLRESERRTFLRQRSFPPLYPLSRSGTRGRPRELRPRIRFPR